MELTEFDIATTNQEIQMLKAFIPFVEPSLQRTLALCIRLFELISTLDFYNHLGEDCPLNRKTKDKKAIFNEIKKYCEENLAAYERPAEYEFKESIPKTAIGKVAYRDLED